MDVYLELGSKKVFACAAEWPGRRAPTSAWPARYLARRTAWHALDHAWEIEDRAEPGPSDTP